MPHQCTNCARRFDDGSKEMLSGCPNCGGTKFQYLPTGLDRDAGTGGDLEAAAAPTPERPDQRLPTEPPSPDTSAVAERVGRATARLRDVVGDARIGSPLRGDDQNAVAADGPVEPEDSAQSSARTEMVSAEELPERPRSVAGGVASFGDRGGDGETGSGDAVGDGVTASGDVDRIDGTDPGATDGDGFGGRDGAPPGNEHDREHAGRVVEAPSERRPDLAELREELNEQFEGIRICEPGQYELNLMELYEREETIIALRENGRYVIEPPESWRGD